MVEPPHETDAFIFNQNTMPTALIRTHYFIVFFFGVFIIVFKNSFLTAGILVGAQLGLLLFLFALLQGHVGCCSRLCVGDEIFEEWFIGIL